MIWFHVASHCERRFFCEVSMDDVHEIQKVIARFANSFDVKDWDGMLSCFTDELYTDYSDLRGAPPQTVSAADYVKSRRESLDHLKLHHIVGNYEADFPDSNSARCRASMVVWRRGYCGMKGPRPFGQGRSGRDKSHPVGLKESQDPERLENSGP
ncbi:MAG: hypothetical protein B6D40_02510 [Anaerolineae bacterium UTCFX3]|nr:MAG: hypothetical protein B6D40_02510 [Anaerolineae bacterium UTCFX3]